MSNQDTRLRFNKNLAAIILVGSVALVALATVYAKDVLREVHYISFIWYQMLVASIVMSFVLVLSPEKNFSKVPFRIWGVILCIGLLNFLIVRSIFIFALNLIPATTHAYIINFVGIVTMLLSALLLREHPARKQILGALIALAGIRLYFWDAPLSGELTGIVLLVFAVLCLALTNIFMRYFHHINHGMLSSSQIVSLSVLSGAIPLIAVGYLYLPSGESINTYGWLVIIANGLLSVCLIMFVFNYVLRSLKAYEASILANTGVVFTAIFSSLILEEKITWLEWSGIIILLSGIYLVQRGSVAKP